MKHVPIPPTPPEYRLMTLVCDQCGASMLHFWELCTRSRHRKSEDDLALAAFLREKLGREWFMELFRFAEPEFRVTVIDESNDRDLQALFAKRRLGKYRIKHLAEDFCFRVACLFGDPVPLNQSGDESD